MTWIKTILSAIVGFRDILKVLKSAWLILTDWYRQWQNTRKAKALAKAVIKAKATKDTSDIEKNFRNK